MFRRNSNSPSSKARIEAFSDGVFAIAITLLVLEVTVPEEAADGQLWSALGRLWPSYLAYAISFFTIGVMWVSHHDLVRMYRVADHGLLYWNLLLLAMVSFVPFPTSVIASYINSESASNVRAAVVFYGVTMVALGAAFSLLYRHLLTHPEMWDSWVAPERPRLGAFRSVTGTAGYVAGTVLALAVPKIALGVFLLLAIGFALSRLPGPQPEPAPGEVSAAS